LETKSSLRLPTSHTEPYIRQDETLTRKQNGIEAKRIEAKRIEAKRTEPKRIERYEVIVVIDNERNGRERKREKTIEGPRR
jgi:hypothetical protein